MTKQEAMKELSKIVSESKQQRKLALQQAIKLADEHGLSFVWDETYGSQEQEYFGKGSFSEQYNYATNKYEKVKIEEGKWTSSSDGC